MGRSLFPFHIIRITKIVHSPLGIKSNFPDFQPSLVFINSTNQEAPWYNQSVSMFWPMGRLTNDSVFRFWFWFYWAEMLEVWPIRRQPCSANQETVCVDQWGGSSVILSFGQILIWSSLCWDIGFWSQGWDFVGWMVVKAVIVTQAMKLEVLAVQYEVGMR